jgi:4-amino-4-deoxy-L-arabinose transferase-like glycosyltransferase
MDRSIEAAAATPAGRSSRDLGLLFLVFALLLLPSIGGRALWEPDEARYAEIPREMLAGGDFVTPRLNGILYFEKPPLIYWLEAGAQRLLGRDPWALRLPIALLALGGIAAVYFAARSLYGRRAALGAAIVLASCPLYFGMAQVLSLDMGVSVFLSAALLAFLLATREPPGRRRRLLLWSFFAAAALATLTKGLIGVVLPGLVIVVWIVATRRWRHLALAFDPSGIALFLLIAAPWHLLAARAYPDFAWFYFVHEHFQRFLTKVHRRYEPAWFFVPVLLGGMLPWTVFLPTALVRSFRRALGRKESAAPAFAAGADRADLYLLLWAGLIFAFFSVSDSKLVPYILPVLPPLALLVGRSLAEAWEGAGRGSAPLRLGPPLVALLGVAALLAVPALFPSLLGGPRALEYVQALGGFRWALAGAVLAMGVVPLLAWWSGRRRAAPPVRAAVPAIVAIAASAALFLGTLGAAIPRLDPYRSAEGIAALLRPRLAPGDEVVVYRDYLQGLPYYLERRITIAGYLGELEFGTHAEPQTASWMIDDPELLHRWQGAQRVFLVTKTSDLWRLPAIPDDHVLGRSGRYLVLTNR